MKNQIGMTFACGTSFGSQKGTSGAWGMSNYAWKGDREPTPWLRDPDDWVHDPIGW
jgi:hypothetical protein